MMKNSIKELTEGMQRLCAVANRVVASEGASRIEVDLLLEDLRYLYDVALRMSDAGQPEAIRPLSTERMPDEEILSSTVMATMAAMSVPEPVVAEEPATEPEVVVESRVEPEPVVEPEPEPEAVPEPVIIPEPEPQPRMEELEANGNSLLFDEVVIEEEVKVEEEVKAEVPEPVSAAGSQVSLLDYLKRPVEEQPTVRTLGETLGEQSPLSGQQSVVGNQHKVSDLRTVININDKFSFMSELFHNNMKAYNDFIMRLNAIDNRDEALLCVNEVSAQYRWDEASLAVQTFYKVFDKKF